MTVGLSAINVRSVGSKGNAQATTGVTIMLQESKNKQWCWHSGRMAAEMAVSRLKDTNDF